MTWAMWGVSAALAASVNVSPGDDLTAVTTSLQPGDVVLFNEGTYVLDGTVYWSGVGTQSEPIEFKAVGGAEVILQNNGGGWTAMVENSDWINFTGLIFEAAGDIEYTQPAGLLIRESRNITVNQCRIRNVYGTGLYIDGNTSGITIRNTEITGTMDGSGIAVGCWDASCWMQDSVLEFNLIHDVEGTGIYLNHGTQGNRIEHNVVFLTRDSGLYMGSTALGPKNTIKGNAIWQAGDNGMYLEGSALVQNNVIFQAAGDGIYSEDEEGSLVDLQISHNTIADTGGYAAYLNDWFHGSDLVFANNALSNPTGLGLRWEDELNDPYGTSTGGPDSDNYISSNVVTGYVEGFDLVNRPGFVIPGGGVSDFVAMDDFDFYPSGSSVLRDAADPDGRAYLPGDDFNGTQRDGAQPDVGAYEYDGDGNPGWVIQEGFKSLEPSAGQLAPTVSSGCCGGGGSKTEPTEALVILPLMSVGWLFRRRSHRR